MIVWGEHGIGKHWDVIVSTLADIVDSLWKSWSGPQLVLVLTLSAITIFRKEMSCNRCYVKQEDQPEPSQQPTTSINPTPVDHPNTVSEPLPMPVEANHETPPLHQHQHILNSYHASLRSLIVLRLTSAWTTARERWSKALSVDVFNVSPAALLPPLPPPPPSAMMKSALHRSPSLLTEELLDGAGFFCSGFPYTVKLLHSTPPLDDTAHSTCGAFATVLPTDAHVHVLSFLHPKDIIQHAMVNKACHNFVHVDPITSSTVWGMLWKRDYAWLVERWNVGRARWRQSLQQAGMEQLNLSHSADFYFRFALTYMNFVLAGQNTFDRCLVGIGGHIYDLTGFLIRHPGSPETVMAHAGQEATALFAGMNHSARARRLAQSLCVVVDMAIHDQSCGVRPTAAAIMEWPNDDGSNNNNNNIIFDHHQWDGMSSSSLSSLSLPANTSSSKGLPRTVEPPTTYHSQLITAPAGVLYRIREELRNEEISWRQQIQQQQQQQQRSYKLTDVLGDVHVYYDPVLQNWNAWYTNVQLQTIYVVNRQQ